MKQEFKSSLFILLCLIFVGTIQAQDSFSTIKYDRIVNIHMHLTGAQEMLKSQVPESLTSTIEYSYNDKMAQFKEKTEGLGAMVSGVMGDVMGDTYFDFENTQVRSYNTVDGDKFFCKKPLKADMTLKPTGKEKKILNYNCKEYTDDEGKTLIYVTDKLPKYTTPQAGLQTDGAILGIKIESAGIEYIAKEITKSKQGEKLSFPTDAQEVTPEQYDDLMQEKVDEISNGFGLDTKVITK